MKYYLFISLILLNIGSVLSQKSKKEKFLNIYSKAATDTNLLKSQLEKCYNLYKHKEYDSSIVLLSDLKIITKDSIPINLKANMYRISGLNHKGKGNMYKAIDNFLIALKLYEKINSKYRIIELNELLGVCFDIQTNHALALKFYFKTINLKQEIKDTNSYFTTYNNIGCCYIEKTQYDSALFYFFKALKLSETITNKNKLAALYLNIGNVFKEKKDYLNTLLWNSKALNYSRNLPNELDKANLYLEIGLDYQLLNKTELANKYIDTAAYYSNKIHEKLERNEFYTLFIDYYTKTENYKKANEFLVKKGKLKDTLFNEQLAIGNVELISKYDAERKDKELILKDQEILKQSIVSYRKDLTNYILVTFLALFTIILIFMFMRIKSKEKTNTLLENKNKEIEIKSLEIKEQAVMLAKFQSQMNPHFIFNALAGMQASIIAEDYTKSLNQLQKFSKLMRLTLNLSSEEYISIGTEIDYIKQYISFELDRFVNKFSLNVYIDKAIDSNSTYIPPMLIQPIVENSIKHAGLNKISNGNININISLIEYSTSTYLLKVIVSDNGCGFNFALLNLNTNSKGINITKQRIKIATKELFSKNDYFEIESNTFGANKGTFTTFFLPYKTNLNR